MLNHTKKIKEIYEVIQKMIFYMIPEKWDKLYLYSSVIDMPEGKKTGELYFYYIPKGILRKKPVAEMGWKLLLSQKLGRCRTRRLAAASE